MFKKASKFEKVYDVKLKENLDDALNNFDAENYQVDVDGQWEKATPISKFRKTLSDEELHFPAAVDSNHIVFFDENSDAQVMNMIPEHHLDSLHNPEEDSKWIKRAQD
jgi:hypothetical protein